ncbi:TniB family NTP-binding protein [Salimicrobium flavidum]|uniref:TniB protein n=1 Tax=Salimicrobium flavidum TaxID=570947 RepID=A0A1N7J262_9BACI|nr:AAA family ATPase [Salimicrobium flavidum]SIS43472.1 TniB protein [Salimicrobium flavidum]
MSENKRAFNEDLLTKAFEERVEYFEDRTLLHDKLIETLNYLERAIMWGAGYNIILVVGPSGVGKSKLYNMIYKSILEKMKDEMEVDKSLIPIVRTELPNPDLGKFNWKDFYSRILTSINEPLINKKYNVDHLINQSDKRKTNTSGTGQELRRSIEKAVYHRGTKAILIDEAQHFFNVGSGKAVTSQFNSLKSLANMSGAKIVMFGTYDLTSVINLDGQLSRRVKELHFPRYLYQEKKDFIDFQSLLYSFQKVVPIEEEPDFVSKTEYMYDHSLGCAGILKDWIQRSYLDALTNNEKTINFSHLDNNKLKTDKLIRLSNEAISGERHLNNNESDLERLKSLLGTNSKVKKENNEGRRKNTQPGKRKPSRDVVN